MRDAVAAIQGDTIVIERPVGQRLGTLEATAASGLGYGLYSEAMLTAVLTALETIPSFDRFWLAELIHASVQSLQEQRSRAFEGAGNPSLVNAYDQAIDRLRSRVDAISQID